VVRAVSGWWFRGQGLIGIGTPNSARARISPRAWLLASYSFSAKELRLFRPAVLHDKTVRIRNMGTMVA
jgi:hypothetical protein